MNLAVNAPEFNQKPRNGFMHFEAEFDLKVNSFLMVLKQSTEENIRADSLQIRAVIEIEKILDRILSSLSTK
jgi:hypothetical protein